MTSEMDTEQVVLEQDDKKWDRVWTTDEIRKSSANWTLAGDVGLYNLLNEFSQNIISRTHEVQNAVDSLVHNTKMASVKVNNVINDFHMLSNLQFVENRVYDEEVQDPTPETKPIEKTKEQREAEMLPKLIKAVKLGMSVLDQAFNRINVNEISDSEDEDLSSEGRVVFEPKNPYEHRPLPFIIGSDEFMADDYAGLKDLIHEDAETSGEIESSSTESDQTSSDEEDLPLDDDLSGVPSPRKEIQTTTDRYSSESEESELFGVEREENGFLTDSTEDAKLKEEKINQNPSEETEVEVRDTRQSSVSSMQAKLKLPQVLPMPKQQPNKKKERDDLFANDDESDDDSPFTKKTGLFTTGPKFDDEKDMFEDDLFGSKPKKPSKPVETPKVLPIKVQPKPPSAIPKNKEPDLFGEDEDSEDDIFNKLSKVKKPSFTKDTFNPIVESPDKGDSSSTPSSAPSIKASGSAFDFMTGGRNTDPLFGEDSDGDDLFSTKNTVTKKFAFAAADDDDADDLFSLPTEKQTKKTEAPEKKKEETEKTDALFNPKSSTEKSYKKFGVALPALVLKKPKDSLFEDSDNSDQGEKKVDTSVQKNTKPSILFDEDDDDEEDIFSQKPKLFSPGKSPSMKNKPDDSLPTVISKDEIKKEPSADKIKQPSLFDDFDKEDKNELSLPTKKEPKTSLFEESDNFDLFKPAAAKRTNKIEASSPAPVSESEEKSSLFNTSDEMDSIFSKPEVSTSDSKSLFNTPDKADGILSSKPQIAPVSVTTDESESVVAGFDVPVDTSNTLNVISKNRAKITTKRRKPTRKGRLAALENNSADNMSDTLPSSSPPAKSSTTDSADDLFSSEEQEAVAKQAVTHKTQEKKKMDLMSQLISEAASSKVGKKLAAPKEEEEDVVDIFAELGGGNRDKSQSFSFKSPIESSSNTSFLDDDKVEEKGASEDFLTSVEVENDEFFTEPSFRNFSNSVSKKESILDLVDDDDDLFSIKPSSEIKIKVDASANDDIFAEDDTDIFANISKEKYEMFPSQLYDDEDDDIFSNVEPSSSKTVTKASNSVPAQKEEKKAVKEVEKKPAFEDPLTGLLGND